MVRPVSVVPSARLALHSFFFSLPPSRISNLDEILFTFSLLHLSLCSAFALPFASPLFYSALCFPRGDKKEKKNIFLVCATSFQALSVSQSRPLFRAPLLGRRELRECGTAGLCRQARLLNLLRVQRFLRHLSSSSSCCYLYLPPRLIPSASYRQNPSPLSQLGWGRTCLTAGPFAFPLARPHSIHSLALILVHPVGRSRVL